MDKAIFKPTALLVMEHNITGLKYFCKTTMLDRVHRYKGSGLAWTKHLRKNGFDVKAGILGFYVDEKQCLEAAKKFSQENNIVDSNEWANAVVETGKNGCSMVGERNPFYGKTHTPEVRESMRLARLGRSVNKGAYRSPEQRAKISASLKGRKNPAMSQRLTGRKLTAETKAKLSEAGKKKVWSDETREKIRQASLAQWAKYRANGNKHIPADEGTP
jgi:hypothetical protein